MDQSRVPPILQTAQCIAQMMHVWPMPTTKRLGSATHNRIPPDSRNSSIQLCHRIWNVDAVRKHFQAQRFDIVVLVFAAVVAGALMPSQAISSETKTIAYCLSCVASVECSPT